MASSFERVMFASFQELGLRLPLCLTRRWLARTLLLLDAGLGAASAAAPGALA